MSTSASCMQEGAACHCVRAQVLSHLDVLLPSLFDALSAPTIEHAQPQARACQYRCSVRAGAGAPGCAAARPVRRAAAPTAEHADLGLVHAKLGAACAQVLAHLDVLLPSLFDALSAPSDRVVAEALTVQAAIAADDPAQFRALMTELLDRCARCRRCDQGSWFYAFRV